MGLLRGWPGFNFSPPINKKAAEDQRLKYPWRWRDSNSRPNIFSVSFLHAYFLHWMSGRRRGGTNQRLPYPLKFCAQATENMGAIPLLVWFVGNSGNGQPPYADIMDANLSTRQPWQS